MTVSSSETDRTKTNRTIQPRAGWSRLVRRSSKSKGGRHNPPSPRFITADRDPSYELGPVQSLQAVHCAAS
jgi:hypothetical protein